MRTSTAAQMIRSPVLTDMPPHLSRARFPASALRHSQVPRATRRFALLDSPAPPDRLAERRARIDSRRHSRRPPDRVYTKTPPASLSILRWERGGNARVQDHADHGGYPNTLVAGNLPLQASGLTCPWRSGRIGARDRQAAPT